MTKADELLREARQLGAIFQVRPGESIHWQSPQPLPDHLLGGLRDHKPELLVLLGRIPDYASTACICSVPRGDDPPTEVSNPPEKCGRRDDPCDTTHHHPVALISPKMTEGHPEGRPAV